MYEDKRTIDATGMLSQRTKPTYQPKPIKLQFQQAGHPHPLHTNPDKARQEDIEYRERMYNLQVQGQKNSGGGGTIICTRLHALGLLSDEVYEADKQYGQVVKLFQPELMRWYHSWAPCVVKRLNLDTWHGWVFTHCIAALARPWAQEMAYRMGVGRGNILGRWMMRYAVWRTKSLLNDLSREEALYLLNGVDRPFMDQVHYYMAVKYKMEHTQPEKQPKGFMG